MNKVTINNQVVAMRKFVKQAKIRAINNYTKEIRKLQNRRGSDDETAKHKRKAERLLAKVVILRKIKPDIVSRKALSKEKDWNAVLKEKNIPLEDQCYAMLANYAAVQTEVEKFHKKNWDLVEKIPTLFKDWEEKSKDPLNKQQRKEAKKLRKNMRNVKLEKNSSNATPIGTKQDAEIIENKTLDKNTSSDSLVNVENTEEAMAVDDGMEGNKPFQIDSKPNYLSIDQIDTLEREEMTGYKNKDIKEEIITPRKKVNLSKKPYSKNNLKAVKINLNKPQNSDETPIEMTHGVVLNKNVERAIEIDDKQVKRKPAQNNSKPNSLSIVGSDTMEKEDISESGNEENSESENEGISESENERISESENEGISESENEGISESDNEDISENEEIKEKALISRNRSPILQGKKTTQDIQSRLKAISYNNEKADTKSNRQFKAKLDAAKKSVSKNKLKAVTMLNLNELQDLDEIPIEKTNEIDEEVEENKRKKDSFFLGKGGEVLSESEDEDSANREQELDRPALKKRKFDNFEKTSNDFSKRRSLPSDSRSNFRDNGFQRNSRFGDRNNSFNNKDRQGSDFKGKGFQNKSFGDRNNSFNNKERQSSDFKGKGFQNKSFGDRNNSFNTKERQTSDFKGKGFENKSYGEKFPSQQFKQHNQTEARNKKPFPKDNSSNLKKNSTDEKPLHPSWEAKKKLKEAAASKFQGKRMVFDD